MTRSKNQHGFTLLEVLVASLIMAIAVTGLLSALSTSLRSAARLTDYDRAALLARQKMDELLIGTKLMKITPFEGTWGPELTGGQPMGWRARLTPFEKPPGAGPGVPFLERIELQIWWQSGDKRRTFTLEGFRRSVLTPEDLAAGGGTP
ncbi:MAG TPA: prepilin-type N-terminal cleavage/methylation domain-containing protein [Bryobacteraceae bacterium]|nr:prepilin-type N-terminal cleavage/methylation domain-containing protein [Bryobacteraceae bacterium]